MFSGLTNQMNSWMGAVKGEGEGGEAPPQNVDAQQIPSEIATDVTAEPSFENVPVGEEGEDAKASRLLYK